MALLAPGACLVPGADAQSTAQPPRQPPPPPPAPPAPPAPKPPPPRRPVYSLIAPFAAGAGQGVLVRGSGFGARRSVVVTVGGQQIQAMTNSIGNFATGFVVSGMRPGYYAVVSQGAGREVKSTVRIVPGRRRPVAVVTSSTGARLSGSSTLGRPGTGLRVVARGLPPGASAVLVFGGKVMAKGKVGPGGAFVRSFGVPAQDPGRHQFWVRVGRLKLTSYFDILPPWRAGLRGGVRMVAAGDIACQPGQPDSRITCQQAATGQLAASLHPRVVALLGDNQYPSGAIPAYAGSFDAAWGVLKSRMRPAPGNHEYLVPQASGYYTYFGSAARPPAGWYSYNLGSWHIVALNTNCPFVDCGAQDAWLRADLAANPRRCTLAYFHHPRFSSAGHYESPLQVYDRQVTQAFWNALYEHGADVVLNGHSHIAERFASQDPSSNPAPGRGIAQFTVGSGGVNHDRIVGVARNSRFRTGAFGVLELALGAGRYRWRFLRAPDGRVLDAGSSGCH